MNRERNKFLTEAMGECWHEWKTKKEKYHLQLCIHCRADKVFHKNTDFSTWEGFGKLWEWAQKQDWWEDLCQTFYGWSIGHYDLLLLIKPDRFADTIYAYLKEKDK